MAFIVPMHCNKPNITYLLTYHLYLSMSICRQMAWFPEHNLISFGIFWSWFHVHLKPVASIVAGIFMSHWAQPFMVFFIPDAVVAFPSMHSLDNGFHGHFFQHIEALTHLLLDKMAAMLADDIFHCIFLNGNDRIPIQISLKYVLRSPIDNKPTLVHLFGAKPLPEPCWPSSLTHICGTRGRWVNRMSTIWKWNFHIYFHERKGVNFDSNFS